jgi:hypothetical protein
MSQSNLILATAILTNGVVVLGAVALYMAYRVRRQVRVEEMRELQSSVADIQRSLDGVMYEIERIGEAQRFTAKILAEATAPSQRPRATSKTITTH